MSNISIGKLSDVINQELKNYSDEVTKSVNKAASNVSTELVENIKSDSPIDTGNYKSGWKRAKKDNVFTVHNAKKPELTALLEYGRINKDGKRIAAKPHIMKNGERAKEKFENLCIDIVSEGLRLK